jgi:signal transduction histidine kinase
MYSEEIAFYYTLLISSIVLLVFMTSFLITIIRYHRKKIAIQRDIENRDMKLLEEERNRMAYDLHDALAPLMTAIHIRLNLLNPNEIPPSSIIAEMKNLLNQTVDRIREVSNNLVPKSLDAEGLLVAFKELAKVITASHHIPVRVHNVTGLPRIDKEREIHVYRMVEEILNNAGRHAQASQVLLNVSCSDDTLTLIINDDGTGFDLNEIKREKKGLGLRNIVARAELLRAKIFWESNKDAGTTFFIHIPVYI